ncbi:MAG TPA: contractile injection system tape measure protein, partial [Gallionella sp.]|nr:contractile injection system tape measure protein [Gallionella sp.]
GETANVWDELRINHGGLVREAFMQSPGNDESAKKLARGFPVAMLLELVRVLAPQDSGFIETLARLPELRGAGSAKNEAFWAYTFGYLHACELRGYDRAEYARGLVRRMHGRSAEQDKLPQAMLEIAPGLREPLADLLAGASAEMIAPVYAGETARAHELYACLVRRLHGVRDGEHDLAAVIAELADAYPATLAHLHRQLLSGEVAADVGALDALEARQLAISLIRLNPGAQGVEFVRSVEAHARQAQDPQRYYRHVLEKLIRNQTVDLETAVNQAQAAAAQKEIQPFQTDAAAEAQARTAYLRAVLDAALTEGPGGEIFALWDELRVNHDGLVREVFARRMGDEKRVRKLAAGLPESMLLELLTILAPQESRFVATLCGLPELRAAGSAKNADFWIYTLGYLHERGARDWGRAEYARGLIRRMQGDGEAQQRLLHAMGEILPELQDAASALPDEPEMDEPGTDARAPLSAVGSADELHECVARRLGGEWRGEQDLTGAIARLESAYPATLASLYRQLQSGALRADVGMLSMREARQLVSALVRLTSGAQGGEFLRAIERHAGLAQSERDYYRNILEKLIRDEIIDLEAAGNDARATAMSANTQGDAEARTARLRSLLDEAFSTGRSEGVGAEWREICDRHAALLRESFIRWMGNESVREKVSRGFTGAMLEDMVRIFAPSESRFIATLAAQPEFSSTILWKHTLAYLHATAHSDFDRQAYAAALLGHGEEQGWARDDVRRAMERLDPGPGGRLPGNPERRADGPDESRAAKRADELYDRVVRRLAGNVGGEQDVAAEMAELANDHPAAFARLGRQLQSGELHADVGTLSMREAKQLVVSLIGLNPRGGEFLRAIEKHAGQAPRVQAYYRNILARLIRDEVVDLEEAVREAAPDAIEQAPVRGLTQGSGPENGTVAPDEKRSQHSVEAAQSGTDAERLAARAAQESAPNPGGGLRASGDDGQDAMDEIEEEVYIANAGAVLLTPYLPQLFRMLDLMDGPKFKDARSAERAIHLLQFAVNERCDSPEFLLVLNKILCGVVSRVPIVREIEPLAREKETIEGMLRAVIGNWSILGNTSVQGLRESFLQRRGRLQLKEEGWHLKVEQRGIDVLIDRLPWSISIIRHPWMTRPVFVEWR